jgi:hypothetical protein
LTYLGRFSYIETGDKGAIEKVPQILTHKTTAAARIKIRAAAFAY